MRYIACDTKGCDNNGAPYQAEDADDREHLCPICEEPLTSIGDPTVADEPKKKRSRK